MIESILISGLSGVALTVLMRKRGPFHIFAQLRNDVGYPLQCEVCAPAWCTILCHIIYILLTRNLSNSLLVLPAIGLTYIGLGMIGAQVYLHKVED